MSAIRDDIMAQAMPTPEELRTTKVVAIPIQEAAANHNLDPALLDALVNQQGGYVRKRSTTLAHLARRHREEVRKQLQGVLGVRPPVHARSDSQPHGSR